MERPKVFISVGSNGSAAQRAATDQIFSVIQSCGLSPRQMEKNEWTSEQPLRGIRKVIDECDGAVVVAFARYEFPTGIEHKKGDQRAELRDIRFPTVWNQIEAALAYGRDLPLLVICEHGLHDDGLLEGRYDWKVFWTDFSTAELASERFIGYLESWKKLVLARKVPAARVPPVQAPHAPQDTDLSKLPLSRLLGMLTLPQIVAVLGTLFSMFAAVAAAAYKLGGGRWPWA